MKKRRTCLRILVIILTLVLMIGCLDCLVFAGSSGEQIVYWVPNGTVFHIRKDCTTLRNSKTILEGTVEESHKPRVCKVCGNISNDGTTVYNGWRKIGSYWYYFHDDGTMQTGWQKISGAWYYFSNGGVMQSGWQKISGTWYYFGSDGAMQTGWQKIGGTWYYFSSSGAMQTGWQKISGTWYYFSSSGAMQTSWQTINGKQYYFKSNGAMASDEWCGGWYLNADGSWTYPYKATWRQGADGRWWFGDTSGWYAKGKTVVIDGTAYAFDAAGWWVQ